MLLLIVNLYKHRDELDYNSKLCYFTRTVYNLVTHHECSLAKYRITDEHALHSLNTLSINTLDTTSTTSNDVQSEQASNFITHSYVLRECVVYTKNNEFIPLTLSDDLIKLLNDQLESPYSEIGIKHHIIDVGSMLIFIDNTFDKLSFKLGAPSKLVIPNDYIKFVSVNKPTNILYHYMNRKCNFGYHRAIMQNIESCINNVIKMLYRDLTQCNPHIINLLEIEFVQKDELNERIQIKKAKKAAQKEIECKLKEVNESLITLNSNLEYQEKELLKWMHESLNKLKSEINDMQQLQHELEQEYEELNKT